MPRYTHAIDTVDTGTGEETETARMWRQIDPQVHHATKVLCEDEAEDRGSEPQ